MSDERERLISEILLTKAGRRKLAESMAQPICPVCRRGYRDFVAHCDAVGDDLHLAASVMST